MSAVPELDQQTGELWIAEPTLSVLVSHTTGHTAMQAGVNETRGELESLRSAGVLDESGKAAHPALASALETIASPGMCHLELSYKGRAMLGWVGYQAAAFLLPAAEGDDRRKLVPLPLAVVAGALARLVDLGERPRPDPAAPVPYQGGTLPGVRRHWRLTVVPAAADGSPDPRALEVVDTDGGLWMLHPGEDGAVVAWPSTPTRVWRLIVRIITSGDVPE